MENDAGLVALVERARGGDPAAWESLYRRAYPRLLAYARRRLAPDDAAKDAVAETMARAVRGMPSYRGEGAGFDAWLAGIVRHVVLDAQRRRARKPASSLPAAWDASDGRDGAEDQLVREEEAGAVRAAFERLPEGDRELLELRVVLGLSAEEVADVLGKRAGAVRMAQAR
ncbi:MAG TPA: sigma-70 family RNA polymerase sigma factor, partial [Acidimicrobiales bacterium]